MAIAHEGEFSSNNGWNGIFEYIQKLIYGKLLETRGVQTMIRLFPEDVHGSWTVMDQPSKTKNPTIQEAQMEGMKWLLSQSQRRGE